MPLTAEQEAAVVKLVTDPGAVIFASDGGKKALADAVGEATTNLSKQTTEMAAGLKTLTETVGKLGSGGGGKEPDKKGDDKDKGKGGAGGEPNIAELIKAGIAEAVKPLSEKLGAIEAEKAKAAEASTRKAMIEKVLKDKKHSGLTADETFMELLELKGVKDEAAVVAELDKYKARRKAQGFDVKETSADPAKEGAKKSPEEGKAAFAEHAAAVLKADRERGAAKV